MVNLLNLIESNIIELKKDLTYYVEDFDVVVTNENNTTVFYQSVINDNEIINRKHICNNTDSLFNQFNQFIASGI